MEKLFLIQKFEKSMKNGCEIVWTVNASDELDVVINYLENNWTQRELIKFSKNLNEVLNIISNNPQIFPKTKKSNVRRAVFNKLNIIYYRIINENIVEILSFFSTRRNPINKYY